MPSGCAWSNQIGKRAAGDASRASAVAANDAAPGSPTSAAAKAPRVTDEAAPADSRARDRQAEFNDWLASDEWSSPLDLEMVADEGAEGVTAPATPRWRHSGIDRILAAKGAAYGTLVDTLAAASSASPLMRANAAIALARTGDQTCIGALVEAIDHRELPLGARRAAIEALADLPEPVAVPELLALFARYGYSATADRESSLSAPRGNYVPDLHVELLGGLRRHAEVAGPALFEAALDSPAAQVRREALRYWIDAPDRPLPDVARQRLGDPEPMVRIAALRAVATQAANAPHTDSMSDIDSTADDGPRVDAVTALVRALRDTDPAVRHEAIEAMGRVGGEQARATLLELAHSGGEAQRAAALTALAAAGDRNALVAAASDEAWRVRLAVARALARDPGREGARLARRLLADASPEVQAATVEAVAAWPLELAGPVWLEALSQETFRTRKVAAEQLSARWAPARRFDPQAAPPQREQLCRELGDEWAREFGQAWLAIEALPPANANDPAVRTAAVTDSSAMESAATVTAVKSAAAAAVTSPSTTDTALDPAAHQRLAALLDRLRDPSLDAQELSAVLVQLERWDDSLIDLLEQMAEVEGRWIDEVVYERVLPARGATFAALRDLSLDDVELRRRAAATLAIEAQQHPLRPLALQRLVWLVSRESDSLVWRGALETVASDPSPPAAHLATVGMGHLSPDVRRRASEYLARYPHPRHRGTLIETLHDDDPQVVRHAVAALGACGDVEAVAQLEPLLLSSDHELRVVVAVSLARLGASQGGEALVRLTHDRDGNVRRLAALALGELADPAFVEPLIRLLDDNHTVATAALVSLPKVAGEGVVPPDAKAPSPAQIAHWKRWWADEQLLPRR